MMKRAFAVLLAISILAFWGFSAAAAPKGKVVIGMAGNVTTFDPHVDSSLPISMHHPNVFDTLLQRTPDGRIAPLLAKSYRLVSPKVWEFKLVSGVKFSNGEPVNAEAVKFSFGRIFDPKLKSRQYSYFKSIERVEAVDDLTVRIHTKRPDPMLPAFLAIFGFITPPKYYSEHDAAYLARHPIGSGPFILKKWSKGEEAVYEANPNYWGKDKPRVKTAVVKFIPEPTTRVSALLSGDVDMVDNVPPTLVPRLKSNPDVEVVAGPVPRTNYILMVIKKGAPWTDPRVRMALNYAIDRESIIKNVLSGYAREVAVLQGPGSFGYNPDLRPFPYDPGKAKKLLAEAGYPKGFSATVYIPKGRFLMGEQVLEAIVGEWSKIGVKAKMRVMEWGALRNFIKTKWKPNVKPFLYFLARMDTAFSAEGMYAGSIYSRSIYGGFRDPEVDKMIEHARQIMDEEERAKAYMKINEILRDKKVPMVFLYQNSAIFAKKKNVDWHSRADGKLIAAEVGLK